MSTIFNPRSGPVDLSVILVFPRCHYCTCKSFKSDKGGLPEMDEAMTELWKMTAVKAVARLKKREISPLDLVEASAKRIAEVEPAVNTMPTLCLDRAPDHAQRVTARAGVFGTFSGAG